MSLFKNAYKGYKSGGISQFESPVGLLMLTAYNDTNKWLPFKIAMASTGLSYTYNNVTPSVINDIPILASPDYIYSSKTTDDKQPLASADYRISKSMRFTATGATPTARLNLGELLKLTDKSINDFKIVVKSPQTSKTVIAKLQSTPGVNQVTSTFTTSGTANTWSRVFFNPNTATIVGTPNLNAISSIEFELATSGDIIDIFVLEAAQHAEQFSAATLSHRVNVCLTQDGYTEEKTLETAMRKCFNNNIGMVGTGLAYTIGFTTTHMDSRLEAFSHHAVLTYASTTIPAILPPETYTAFAGGTITLPLTSTQRLYPYAEYLDSGNNTIPVSISGSSVTETNFKYDTSLQTLTAPATLDSIKPKLFIKETVSNPVNITQGTDASYNFELAVQTGISGGSLFKTFGSAQMAIPTYTMNNSDPGDTREFSISIFADSQGQYAQEWKA